MGHLWCRPLGGCCVCSVVTESISINFMGRGNYSQEKNICATLGGRRPLHDQDGHYAPYSLTHSRVTHPANLCMICASLKSTDHGYLLPLIVWSQPSFPGEPGDTVERTRQQGTTFPL